MTLKYFADCHTLEELKKIYKKLMLKYHPDINPNALDICQEINAEYDYAFRELQRKEKSKSFYEDYKYDSDDEDEDYDEETKESKSRDNTYEEPNEFKDIINQIIGCKGIVIEIIGTWIWVTGDTKPYKEKLKQLKFIWNNNKSAWFYKSVSYRKRNNYNYTLDDIRSMYGSKRI